VASRETAFLLNNLLFVLLTFTVLLGTLFPLVVEAWKGEQMSVGGPYFDRMAVPVGVALLFLMGVGPALPWGRASARQAVARLLPPALSGMAVAAAGLALGVRSPWTVVALFAGGYTAGVTGRQVWEPVAARRRAGASPGEALAAGTLGAGRRRFAAYVAHLGAVVVIVAIAVSSTMSVGKEVQLAAGESTTLGPYTLTFLGAERRPEPHRVSTIARVEVARGGERVAMLAPRMNQYPNRREPIGTPDVRTGLTGDLYLTLMNVDGGRQSAGFLMKVNPMVGWIWAATGLIALGGLLALVPWRPRRIPEAAASPEALGARGAPGGVGAVGGEAVGEGRP
jgi:cytochrome c-type biogenesis protein CcmF